MKILTYLNGVSFAKKGLICLLACWVQCVVSAATPQPIIPAGYGLYNNPFQITRVENLLWMSQNVNLLAGKYFALVNDIDASDTVHWDSWRGFPPIGSESSPFAGVVTGQGYLISGLIIVRPNSNCTGLFGYVKDGSIANLGLDQCTVVGGGYTGGLVGSLYSGYVSNCNVTGSVTGGSYVGGLLGYAYKSTIQWGYTVAEVSGGDYVGGLIGMNAQEATLSGCYTMGSATGSMYVGGMTGWSNAEIVASYSTATVTGSDRVGGIIGQNAAKVSCCYAVGRVSGKDKYTGGLVGYGNVNLTDSYWDRQTTGQWVSAGSNAAFGLTSAQMKAGWYPGWNFSSFWGVYLDLNQCYPVIENLIPWQTYTGVPQLTHQLEKGKLQLLWAISQGGILEESQEDGTWKAVDASLVSIQGDYYLYSTAMSKSRPQTFYRLSRDVFIQPTPQQ